MLVRDLYEVGRNMANVKPTSSPALASCRIVLYWIKAPRSARCVAASPAGGKPPRPPTAPGR